MECLKNVIGITRKDCDCFEEGKPDDSSLSRSGLYLDELDGLSMLQIDSSSDCGDGSVWEISDKAIKNAELDVRKDLLTMISAKYKDAYSKFSGIVGMRNFNGPLMSLKDMQGLKFESKNIDGGFLILKEIDAYFNETTTDEITVNIYQKGVEVPIYSLDIDTEANKVHKNILSTPIKLPIYVDGFDDLEYYILYSKHATAKPLNNKLYTCSCSYGSADWSQWGDFSGLNVDNFSSVNELESKDSDSYIYGLGLIVQVGCEKSTIICKEGEELDFENDSIAINLAYALQYKAGISLLNKEMTRPDSSDVAINGEQNIFLVNEYTQKYNEVLNYLSVVVEPGNGCFTCDNDFKITPILS
jgi:hypothetical protein